MGFRSRRSFKTAALVCALCGTAIAQTPRVIDFRGIPLGASEKEFVAKNPLFFCRKDEGENSVARRVCQMGGPLANHDSSAFTFAGAQALSIAASFHGDRFESLTAFIKPEDFETVVASLKEQFGKPDSVQIQKAKTLMDVELENPLVYWKLGTGWIIAERYTFEITRGSVVYSDGRLAEERQAFERRILRGKTTGP